MAQAITTVSELYPALYLKPEHLQGRPVTVKITAATVEEFRQPDGTKKTAVVLAFHNASKRLICNKTQAQALVDLLGSERFTDWPGHAITLGVGRAPNGKETIEIRKAEAAHDAGQSAKASGGDRGEVGGAGPGATAGTGPGPAEGAAG